MTRRRTSALPAKSGPSQEAMELEAALPRFGQAYVRWVRGRLQGVVETGAGPSLTVQRLTALGVLASHGERMLMGELGEKLELAPRSVTVLADGLEKEGLVRRVRHETDRRAVWLEITAEGRVTAANVIRPHRAAVAEVFDDLPEADRAGLLRAIRLLLAALDARETGEGS